MTKSKIEYLTHAWNFYTGCNHWKTGVCAVGENCWAYQRAQRFNKGYFTPRLHPELLLDPLKLKKPARIGVCFTGDLFGDWVDPYQLIESQDPRIDGIFLAAAVKQIVRDAGQHQFFFLTKAPGNIHKWGKFSDNAWVGASVCNNKGLTEALSGFMAIPAANHTWLSIEPLYERLDCSSIAVCASYKWVEWVVIGGQSGRHPVMPKIEWIREIVEAADKAGIPVFLKDNLRPILPEFTCGEDWAFQDGGTILLRQELPK